MAGFSSDRNLLLGIVALQMDFISRDELIAAMHGWTLDKTRSLSEILVRNGALDPVERSVLENLVERHIARHGGDPEKSLSSLELVVPSRSTLESLDDPDILESLSKLGVTHTRADDRTDPERKAFGGGTIEETGGRFRIISLHDEGGLGCVFLARDSEVNREVALKQLKEEIASDYQSRARFVFEAEITGNLEHPGIVPVYGKGEYSDGRPYYAMRFIRGDNLKVAVDRFHKNAALKSDAGARQRELQKLLRRFLGVCETMAYAHSRGILHRDIKPRNILLGPYGETLVVDWGLAKVVGHGEVVGYHDATLRPPSGSDIQPTTAGSRVGTPAYMSPEQARGEVEQLGPSADVYSLGATLYYMLVGLPPFAEQDIPEILLKVERGEFRTPRMVKPGVDRALEAICLKAMALRPEDRYSSSRTLAEDIEHWLADQPVSAYPEPITTRLTRWLRSRKQLVAAAIIFLAFGIGGLIYHDRRIAMEQAATTAQLGMTREALRELLGIAGRSLAFVPNTERLREGLAEKVLELNQKLGEKFQNDPGIRLERAQVYRVIGGIGRFTGQFENSRQAYNQAIELLETLRVENPGIVEYSRWLAEAFIDRGELFHMNGETGLSERDFQAAMIQAERLRETPISATYRRVRAAAQINLSEVLVLEDRLDDARAAADTAADLLTPLANAAKPSDLTPGDRWLLSMALTNRGVASLEGSRRSTAEQDFDQAEAVANRIVKEEDEFNDAQFQIACICERRADLLTLEPTRLAEAEKQYERAIQMLGELVAAHKVIPHYREELAVTLAGRAALRTTLGPDRFADAERDCQTSKVLLEALIEDERQKGARINPHYSSLLGRTLTTAGRIHLARGDAVKGQDALAEAAKSMTQATNLDTARVRDHLFLQQIRSQLDGLSGRK